MSYHSRITQGTALTLVLLAACSSDATGPGGAAIPPAQFGQTLSFSQFDSTLGDGPARIEIKLLPGGLVAREVEVEPDDAEEKIVSTATAIDPAAGTITLSLGGMTVNYGAGTRFRTPSSSRVSRGEWEAAISAAINSGGQPPIEARRNPGATPQDPTDPSFTALDLRLESLADEPKIEVYVDRDNLEPVASPPPLAILRVFNLPIEITSSTELSLIFPGGQVPTGSIEFEARVIAVDETAGTLTLAGGTIVEVGTLTFDPEGDLFSLSSTATAVAGGSLVRAEGRGTVSTAGPPATIAATEIKVEVDN
jgi:hypothetical protein